VRESLALLGASIAAFEAPNELDNQGDPGWAPKLVEFVPALDAAVRERAPGVPLIGASLVHPSSRAELLGDLPGAFNGHPYAGGEPPEPWLGNALSEARGGPRERPIYFTEAGYHNALAATTGQAPASEEAAAIYLPRTLLAAFGAGVRRTFVYELLDEKPEPALSDPEQHFGLLRHDLSPKPAFTAIKTLVAALRSSAGEGAGALDWDVRAAGEVVERLTLMRRDGSRVLALWRPVSVWDQDARAAVDPGVVPVELVLGREASDISVWRPSVSEQPVLRRERARRLRLELGGDLVLVSLR
jgi:hypothetical protein